jgi:tetraacyldisaccharide 4'-kinase
MKRPLLAPFIPLYAAAQTLHNALLPTPKRLTRPVLSIGSLSAGGAGKTPVVQALATLLAAHNLPADVLTRGYGRSSQAVEQVDPTGPATRFGDEPLLLAQPGLPVFVGADRHAAGQLAESTLPQIKIHLLDDGFQHRRLQRDLDLVLITASDLADHLLPAGNLREPLRALSRAHALILRAEESQALTSTLRRYTQAPIWLIDRSLSLPLHLPDRPLAFCALARPESFFADLKSRRLNLATTETFPDHHLYTFQNIRRLKLLATRHHANAFLTTAKDAVKLAPALRRSLEETAPLHIAPLTVTFRDEQAVWSTIQPLLATP